MPYIIVTGYHSKDNEKVKSEFFDMWWENTTCTTKENPPQEIYVINSGGKFIGKKRGKWVDFSQNLGHVVDLINNKVDGLCGWTMSTIIGALIAYSENCDMVYKEQDCLAFGDWANELGSTLVGDIMLSTGFNKSLLPFKIEQSLFAIKHEFLLDYVRTYLGFIEGDGQLLPELKWQQIIDEMLPGKCADFGFGYGRERPINYDDKTFYAQQLTKEELCELKKRKLI